MVGMIEILIKMASYEQVGYYEQTVRVDKYLISIIVV